MSETKQSYIGQPPFRPDQEVTDDERAWLREMEGKHVDSQVMVERELIAHITLAFTQAFVVTRNRYLGEAEAQSTAAVAAERKRIVEKFDELNGKSIGCYAFIEDVYGLIDELRGEKQDGK